MTESYSKHVLDNGLTVLLREMHTAPVISHWMWYRVGSRCEPSGKTGISHWVEHMQFKGTERHPARTADLDISRCGGVWNAFTYMDWTAFYETLPADRIDLALDLESDRMMNCLYDPEDTESERTVILSELEGLENEPSHRLKKAILQNAFTAHPYRRETIGSREDLLAMTRDDLYSYYRKHYLPNNAVLVMAGDFDTPDMLRRIEAAYGGIPAGSIPEYDVSPEGPIRNPETIRIQGPCDVDILQMIWRAPSGHDPEIYPLTILDSVLTGPSSLNMFGGGHISNRTSRIYQALVKNGKAAAIGGGFSLTIDPYLYSSAALVVPGMDPLEAAGTIHEEIGRIVREGLSPAELEKARKQARAMFIFSSENITNQAYWLGCSSMFADPSWYTEYLPRLEQVTAEDVSRTAERWLRPENCLTGIYSSD